MEYSKTNAFCYGLFWRWCQSSSSESSGGSGNLLILCVQCRWPVRIIRFLSESLWPSLLLANPLHSHKHTQTAPSPTDCHLRAWITSFGDYWAHSRKLTLLPLLMFVFCKPTLCLGRVAFARDEAWGKPRRCDFPHPAGMLYRVLPTSLEPLGWKEGVPGVWGRWHEGNCWLRETGPGGTAGWREKGRVSRRSLFMESRGPSRPGAPEAEDFPPRLFSPSDLGWTSEQYIMPGDCAGLSWLAFWTVTGM